MFKKTITGILAIIVAIPATLFALSDSKAAAGHITVFFSNSENQVIAATLQNKAWQTSLFDTPPGSVGSTLAASTSADGSSHISYRASDPGKEEFEQSNLRYATNDSGSWQDEEVYHTSGRVGSTAIAVDSNGKIHILFNHYPVGVPNNGELLYANNVSGQWQVEQVNSRASINSGNIAVDSSGIIQTVYESDEELLYATRTEANGWTEEVVSSFDNHLPYVAFKLGTDSKPRAAFVQNDTHELKYTARTNGTWNEELVTSWSGDGDQTTYLALDSSNQPHLILSTGPGNDRDPHYFTRSGDSWVAEEAVSFFEKPHYLGIAISDDDVVHLTFAVARDDEVPQTSDRTVHYARRVNNKWLIDPVYENGSTFLGGFPAITTHGSAPEPADCFGRFFGLYCPGDPSPESNPNLPPVSNENSGGDGGGGGGGGGGEEPQPATKTGKVLGATTATCSARVKNAKAKDFIANKNVPVVVAQIFKEVFGKPITPKESTYWKGRVRCDKPLKGAIIGAMFTHKAKGKTMPPQPKR